MKTMGWKAMALALLASCSVSAAHAAGGDVALDHAEANPADRASVQRGAKWFMNYCAGCHSTQYMRYNRLMEDLQLTEEQVLTNLVYDPEAKIGDRMRIAMPSDAAAQWFGKAPPDLTLVARSRGPDWIYTFLRSFYRDENGGWNNLVLQNAAMPHVMWQLQGIQTPVYGTEVDADGREREVIEELTLTTPGQLEPEEYDRLSRDLVAFLEYLGEPAQAKRKSIGIWVMLFLAVFAFLAYLLKAEFWRDVH